MLNLNSNAPILILSGEGESGSFTLYTGKRTERAIKMRLTRERCHGDRWAKAYIYLHQSDAGPTYANIDEPGDMRTIREED